MDKRLEGITHGISIKQPWAWLIAAGWKDIENRSQCFKHRGAIALHASKVAVDEDEQRFAYDLFVHEYQSRSKYDDGSSTSKAMQFSYATDPNAGSLGAIIGVGTIVGCVHESESRWYMGEHGLVINNPTLFDSPIPWRGALGIWELKEEEAR